MLIDTTFVPLFYVRCCQC